MSKDELVISLSQLPDFQTSTEIDKIVGALAKYHENPPTITKDKENSHFKNKYASLSGILTEVKPALTKVGIILIQAPVGKDGLETRLIHAESGQWISSRYTMPLANQTPQGMGSAITYQKRYALGAMLVLDIEEDDDGHAASAKPSAPAASRPAPSRPASTGGYGDEGEKTTEEFTVLSKEVKTSKAGKDYAVLETDIGGAVAFKNTMNSLQVDGMYRATGTWSESYGKKTFTILGDVEDAMPF